MSRPAPNEYLDPINSRLAMSLLQKSDNFVATKAFPLLKVDDKTGSIYKDKTDTLNRDDAKAREGASESVGYGVGLDSVAYDCVQYSFHVDTDRQQQGRSKGPLNWRRRATKQATLKGMIRLERQMATELLTTSVWGTDKTVATQWDDEGGSDPIGDVSDGKSSVLLATGHEPRSMLCGYNTARALVNHPDIVARFAGSTGPVALTLAQVATVLDLDNIFVSRAIHNTADEGQSENNAFIAGNHALLFHRDVSDSGEEAVTAGRICHWPMFEGAEDGIAISEFPMPNLNGAVRTEVDLCVDPIVGYADLGYFFNSVVSG